MNQGKIEQVGSPQQIYEQPRRHLLQILWEYQLISGRIEAKENSGLRFTQKQT